MTTSDTRKRERLNNLTIHDTIIKNNIKSMNELLPLASPKKVNGKADFACFILDKGIKKVNELIQTSWAMQKANDMTKHREQSSYGVSLMPLMYCLLAV